MANKITPETVLTNDNMSDHDRNSFFMDVAFFIENNSKSGDPHQSLLQWCLNSDYSEIMTVAQATSAWDEERESEDETELGNEKYDAKSDEALNPLNVRGTISEAGNGLDVCEGDFAVDLDNNAVYRVTETGSIQTHQWKANYMQVTVEYFGDPFDIDGDEYDTAWAIEIDS